MKKLLKLMLCVVLALGLVACSGGSVSVDMDALVEELRSAGIFADTAMMPVQSAALRNTYGLSADLVDEWQIYAGTMITGEDIVVLKCTDSKAAKTVKGELEQYKQGLYDLYITYSPEGAARIADGILVQKGEYVVYVASNDTAAAQKIIDKYLG